MIKELDVDYPVAGSLLRTQIAVFFISNLYILKKKFFVTKQSWSASVFSQ
jgi:hypothetical protein